MTQLEQLKHDLANLNERLAIDIARFNERINSVPLLTNDSIILTREQLKDLIVTVQNQTVEYIKTELEDIDLCYDNYVELELNYGREIEVTFDDGSFIRDVKHSISGPEDEITDEGIQNLIEKYK